MTPDAPPPRTMAWARALLVLAWLAPVLLAFQGMDWTDQGFWAANYQQVFRAPESVATSFTCWLTVVLGGAWSALTDPLGLLGIRLGYALAMGLAAQLTYVLLRRVYGAHPLPAAAAVAAGVPFVHASADGALTWLSYNDLSALFLLWAASHLARGLCRDRRAHLVAGGAVLALAPLVRLPNLVAVLLGLAIPFHGFLVRRRPARILGDVAASAGGFVLGALLGFGLMAALGHVGLYVDALRTLSALARDTQGYHGSGALLAGLWRQDLDALGAGARALPLLAAIFGLGALAARLRRPAAIALLGALAGVLVCLPGVPLLSRAVQALVGDRALPATLGVLYVALAALALLPLPGSRERPARRTLALLALLVLLLVPVGSSRYLLNAHYGASLALGVLGVWLFSARGATRTFLFAKVACAVMIVVLGGATLWGTVYRDAWDRGRLVHAVDHPRLWGVFTTASRARVAQELFDALPSHARPGDALLAFEYIPLVHYVSATTPWLPSPNPMYLTAEQFAEGLARADAEGRAPPVIVAGKGNPDVAWPDDVDAGLALGLEKFAPMRAALAAYRLRHGYRRVWENVYFEILVPDPKR